MYVWLASVLMILSGEGQALPFPPTPEAEVWGRVVKVDSVAAYELYLRRFAGGAHRLEAEQALMRLTKAPHVPQAPPVPGPPSPIYSGSPPRDACVALLLAGPSPEAAAFSAARKDNRLVDFKAFLAAYPAGPCSAQTASWVAARADRLRRLVPVPGIGPLGAQQVRGLTIGSDDYPPAEMRAGQSGRVVVEWEVAPDGVPESCRVLQSSGSATLDDATCRIVTRRLLYDPARDAAGAVMRSSDRMSVRWALPPKRRSKPQFARPE